MTLNPATLRRARIIPFLCIATITLCTWITFAISDYGAMMRHKLGLAAVLINALLYLVRYRYGIWGTGVLLALAVTNNISFFASADTFRVGSVLLKTPPVQGRSLLLLLLYILLNAAYLKNSYDTIFEKNDKATGER